MNENTTRIAELIRRGKKLEAVKLLRDTTGMGLEEALREVERLSEGLQTTQTERHATDDDGVREQVKELALAGNKIEAIKLLRQQTSLGLKEAKERVESISGAPRSTGCAGVMIVAVSMGALMAGLAACIL